MAQQSVTANKSKSAAKGTGKLVSIRIDIKGNGFVVTESYEPKTGKNGYPMYEPEKPKDSMVFTDAGECAEYIEKCLGAKKEPGEKY